MIVNVKKRKAGSYKDLTFEKYDIADVSTLEELLVEISKIEMMKLVKGGGQGASKDIEAVDTGMLPSSEEKLEIGKISFGLYDGRVSDLDKAIDVMKQDFADGVFRVFFNEKEYTSLTEVLECQMENELVLIRLVMMAGRLW